MKRVRRRSPALLRASPACRRASARRLRTSIVVALANSPTNLDPGVGLDEASQKLHQLLFSSLLKIDDDLRVVPDLAVRFETTDSQTYVAEIPPGVRFHDGREMTAADVAYTFRRFLDPAFLSGRKGAYRAHRVGGRHRRYTVAFRLKAPSASFPDQPDHGHRARGHGAAAARRPIGSGPYRLGEFVPDDHVTLDAVCRGTTAAAPTNAGLLFKVVPDETMRGLELRKGSVDLVVNDLSPDLVHGLRSEPAVCGSPRRPGTDYAYIGFNLRDPLLADVARAAGHRLRGRSARRSSRTCAAAWPAPRPASCRRCRGPTKPDCLSASRTIPNAPGALLDEAGLSRSGWRRPAPRLRLTLKTSTAEAYRCRPPSFSSTWRDVGIALEIRSYEFATLMSDVIRGNVQLYTLQCVGVTDPDMLRRAFHSSQVPPDGFNRGHYKNAEVGPDCWTPPPRRSTKPSGAGSMARRSAHRRRRAVHQPVGKTNVAVAQPELSGVELSPTADFGFLRHVAPTVLARRNDRARRD